MPKVTFTLLSPDDSRTVTGEWVLEYNVSCNSYPITSLHDNSYTIKPIAGSNRPMFDAMRNNIEKWVSTVLKTTIGEMHTASIIENINLTNGRYIKIDGSVINGDARLPLIIEVMEMVEDGTQVPLSKPLGNGNPVFTSINGKVFETTKSFDSMLTTIVLKTADLTYTNTDVQVWRRDVRQSMEIPVDIKYAITNRTPYSFYYIDNDKQDINLKEVLLNVKRISDTECAIELSDGVWGSFNFEAMQLFIDAFKKDKQNSYTSISPRQLFILSMGRTPTDAEYELMIHYLMQNRTSDIVADRASKMLDDIVSKHGDKVFVEYNEREPDNLFSHVEHISVRGIGCDWKLIPKGNISNAVTVGRQAVVTKIHTGNGRYSESICIDNTNNNSPLGDQIATRILATMNDEFMVSRIHTVSSIYDSHKGKRDSKIDAKISSDFGEEE